MSDEYFMFLNLTQVNKPEAELSREEYHMQKGLGKVRNLGKLITQSQQDCIASFLSVLSQFQIMQL